MSDWEYSDSDCPKCGETLATRRCDALYCEGGTIEDDSDPEWPETERCDECRGNGYLEWCRKCGWDVIESQFLNPQCEAEWLAKQEGKQ